MSERTASEIVELTDSLEQEFTTLRTYAEAGYQVYKGEEEIKLPPNIPPFFQHNVRTPLLKNTVRSVRADMLIGRTEVTVIPEGDEAGLNKTLERQGENLAKIHTVLWGMLDEGYRVTSPALFHLLLSPFAVLLPTWGDSELRADGTLRMPYRVETPDPLTCFFPARGGRGRPLLFARKYQMMVGDVEKLFSKRSKTEHADGNLRLDSFGHWAWLSDDMLVDSGSQLRNLKDTFRLVTVYYLDDGEQIHYAVQNLDVGQDGKSPGRGLLGQFRGRQDGTHLIWKGPNICGGVTAVIVPGEETPFREAQYRWEPWLRPLIESNRVANYILTVRASVSGGQVAPPVYFPMTPELIEARGKAGLTGLPDPMVWEESADGSLKSPYSWAKGEEWPVHQDPDLDKLWQATMADVQRETPSVLELLDTATLKAITATGQLHLSETIQRRLNPMMSALDFGKQQVLEEMEYAADHAYAKERIALWAGGNETVGGQKLARGTRLELTKAAVDFPHRVVVTTQVITEAQRAARIETWERTYQDGLATHADGFEAAGYTDKVEQTRLLAKEAILREEDPLLRMAARAAYQEVIKLESGIDLSAFQGQAPPETAAGGGNGAGGGTRMNAPNVPGPAGGSSPTY